MLETCIGISEHQKCQDCGDGEAGHDGFCDACRHDRLSQKIDLKTLPLSYRLMLKVPGADRIENVSGIFWAIVAPLFIFLSCLVNLYLFVRFAFPYNYLLVSIIPFILLLVFLKIGLKRFINFWNLNFVRSRLDWDVGKLTKDYVKLIRKQEKRKK